MDINGWFDIDYSKDSVWDKICYKYYDIIPYRFRPHNIFYYLKCKFYWKYNRITCKYLSPTWHDRDQILLHSCFQILCDFIEKETPFEILDFEYDENHRQMKREMESLYFWWIDCHTNRTDDDLLLDKAFEEYRKVLYNKCEQQVKRRWSEPILNRAAYELKSEYHDENKYRNYLFAYSKLQAIHEEFINHQLIRLIKLREWLWT